MGAGEAFVIRGGLFLHGSVPGSRSNGTKCVAAERQLIEPIRTRNILALIVRDAEASICIRGTSVRLLDERSLQAP